MSSCCGPRDDAAPRADATFPDAPRRAPHARGGDEAPRPRWCDIPAGTFAMGNDGADAVAGDGEGPVRRVALGAFRIGATTVTNRDFAAFVRATRHVTDAERAGTSFVFYLQLAPAERANAARAVAALPWWIRVEHASWQRPEGPGSHVRERADHPVVHVSWNDAAAYCDWAGARLPSEAEWERAARGGLEGRRFAWGDDLLDATGTPRCNVFRGTFPNAPATGWQPGPVAADAGAANGFGLHNVCGNVWEWCADAREGGERALRGGSFLCHDSYCNRYRVAARSGNTPDSSASNVGFRVVALDEPRRRSLGRAGTSYAFDDERARAGPIKEHTMILGRLVTVAALAAGGYWLKKKLGPAQQGTGQLSFVQDSIEVDVPISMAYNQWTQFEEFPRFMHDVEEVRQVDDTHLHWRARIAGKPVEWDSEITTQIPDRRISWRSTSGPPNSGAVSFDRVTENRTRITLRMSYRAPGIAEKIGDALGAVRAELSGNLHRFADFIQARQRETGAWRGTVSGGTTTTGAGGGDASTGDTVAASTVPGTVSGSTTGGL